MRSLFFCAFTILMLNGHAQSSSIYEEDFDFLLNHLAQEYAFSSEIDWDDIREAYLVDCQGISSRYHFILFLERLLLELRDHHTHLNTNTAESFRLIPTGTDIWCNYDKGNFIIQEVNIHSPVYDVLQPNDIILAFNGIEVDMYIKNFIGKTIDPPTPEALTHGINLMLAGNYVEERIIQVRREGKVLEINAGVCPFPHSYGEDLLTDSLMESNIGYIKVCNTLGNQALISAFDEAIDKFMDTKGLILDLRDTPSGGDAIVAKPLLGRFIGKSLPYQIHEYVKESKKWKEVIHPRGKTYSSPVVVLVNRWTGSMGEGMAVGLHGMKRAKIIGTEMAGLKGATYFTSLPNTNIGINYVAEKIYHVDGTPREDFQPDILVEIEYGEDKILAKGKYWLDQQH